ncbi:sensor domain-containing diguanylate cyclase [Bacillus sp. FJAT-26390]|uniref:sensor domain-containing diguanylate cyclase n=1 Tax=Bacillus sp. FJAT-26390 TaxID=1743142 RepID=UPI000807D0AF|nr:sensor domain-containing diguanylate cyclase [Bacillus sp. FJAT-26390]OBZ11400.1 diguanylate cyclase [Bacillus sp. FJAT-26390]
MSSLRIIKEIKKNKISLATLLTGLVSISVLLTLTILLIASYHSKKQSLYETTLTLNLSNASKMSQTMDSLFKSMRSSLKNAADFYAANPSLHAEDTKSHLNLIRTSSTYFNSIALVDSSGLILAVSPSSIGTAGERILTDAAKEALHSRKPYISKPFVSPTTKNLIVFISEPIYDEEGVYRGYIGGSLYLQKNNVLSMIFGNSGLDNNGSYFYVVGSDGSLLYDPDISQIGKNMSSDSIVQTLMEGKSGYRLTESDGVSLLAGYSYVPENQWGIVVVSEISTIRKRLINQVEQILIYSLFPFILLLLVTIALARRLASPFETLANIVGNIGQKEERRPDLKQHWNREADLLNKAVVLAFDGIKLQTDQLTQAAMTDALTGLSNRRTMESRMKQWTEELKPYAIILLDIDRFKLINDTFGHQEGDKVLQHLANIVKSTARPGDLCSRYGGEEFVVLLPSATVSDAYDISERIRTTMESSESHLKQKVTISLGVAQFPLQSGNADELFVLADQALYKAKHAGRNRTMIAEGTRNEKVHSG